MFFCDHWFGPGTITIQPIPNLSVTMPYRGDLNVFISGMSSLPPEANADGITMHQTCRLHRRILCKEGQNYAGKQRIRLFSDGE